MRRATIVVATVIATVTATATMTAIATAASAASAPAAPTSPARAEPAKRIQLGLHAGVALPQITSDLGTAPAVYLEGGYAMWRNLSAFVTVGVAHPPVDHEATDPRLPASDYQTSTTQRELVVTVGGQWRLLPVESRFNLFGAMGMRSYFLETLTNGSAGGASFLENREMSVRIGGVIAIGGELRLGPGAVTVTTAVGGSDLPHLITGEVQTTALDCLVGYRLFF
ncbi:MAG: hypothetical protein V2A73_04740 [Pseudomonadota bacterium]